MKLLIDQNISHRLKARIASVFPDVFHVKDLDLVDFPDAVIFETARRDNFDAVLTLDEDFHNLVLDAALHPKSSGYVWAIAPCPSKPEHCSTMW